MSSDAIWFWLPQFKYQIVIEWLESNGYPMYNGWSYCRLNGPPTPELELDQQYRSESGVIVWPYFVIIIVTDMALACQLKILFSDIIHRHE